MSGNRIVEYLRMAGNFFRSPAQVPTEESATTMPLLGNNVEQFFNQVAHLKKVINEVQTDVDCVKAMHNESLSSVASSEEMKPELDDMKAKIKRCSQLIRALLKQMENDNRAIVDEGENSSATLRIRKTQYSTLVRQYIDIMQEYQTELSDYRDRCRERVKRQFEIVGYRFSETEFEEMMEHGNLNAFTQNLMLNTKVAKQTLADVTNRHNDILKIEKSITELHDLFVEMSLLVESQGETIERIEAHVTNAGEYVEPGTNHLAKALRNQSAARKKKICIAVFLLLIILILALIVYLTLDKQNTKN